MKKPYSSNLADSTGIRKTEVPYHLLTTLGSRWRARFCSGCCQWSWAGSWSAIPPLAKACGSDLLPIQGRVDEAARDPSFPLQLEQAVLWLFYVLCSIWQWSCQWGPSGSSITMMLSVSRTAIFSQQQWDLIKWCKMGLVITRLHSVCFCPTISTGHDGKIEIQTT